MRDGRTMRVPLRMADAARRELLQNAPSQELAPGKRRRRVGTERDPAGRVLSTWEEQEELEEDGDLVGETSDAVLADSRYRGDPRFYTTAAQRQALSDAYAERERRDQDAWRNPPPRDPIFGSGGEQAPGYTADADQLNPHSRSFSLDAARAARDEAFRRYDEEQENAWRRLV